MAESTFRVDDRDIKFVLYEYLKVDGLLNYPRYKDFSKDDFDMVLTEGIKFAKEVVAPTNSIGDKVGCRYEDGKVIVPEEIADAFRQVSEGGWTGMSSNPELGGQGFPNVVAMAVNEAFVGANLSLLIYTGLSKAAADLLEEYGTDWMKEKVIPKLLSGEWAGTMCLTESQAGSAVGDASTIAKRDGDTYLISGSKIFISGGDQEITDNIIHLVLAKTPDAPKGIKGLSLFLVPKYRFTDSGGRGEFNDVLCAGIEHKMGIKGSATCTLNFGDDDSCQGFLIGNEGEGIRIMFHMMNEARLGVGLQGLSQGAAAYLSALDYAKERVQGVELHEMRNVDAPRVPIIKHPDIKRMLLMMKAYVHGMRGLLYKTANYVDIMLATEDEQEREKAQDRIELFTPIIKSFMSDIGFDVCVQAVQVFGGYGYCSEYPVEQYLRDAKITSIYEGTNGIQALDLLGRKVGRKGGMVYMGFVMELNDIIEKARALEGITPLAEKLDDAKNTLSQMMMDFQQTGMSGDMYYPVLHATPFLASFGEVVTAQVLLEEAMVAKEKLDQIFADKGIADDDAKKALLEDSSEACFYSGKLDAASFFITQILPNVQARSMAAQSNDRSVLNTVFE